MIYLQRVIIYVYYYALSIFESHENVKLISQPYLLNLIILELIAQVNKTDFQAEDCKLMKQQRQLKKSS